MNPAFFLDINDDVKSFPTSPYVSFTAIFYQNQATLYPSIFGVAETAAVFFHALVRIKELVSCFRLFAESYIAFRTLVGQSMASTMTRIRIAKLTYLFMSFCRILSTLCSHVVFHNIPHIFRGWQKSGTKSTSYNRRSGTKCKSTSTFCPALLKSAKNTANKVIYPVLYCPLFPTKICWTILYVLIIKLTKGWDGGFREGGIKDGEIGDGEIIVEGGC